MEHCNTHMEKGNLGTLRLVCHDEYSGIICVPQKSTRRKFLLPGLQLPGNWLCSTLIVLGLAMAIGKFTCEE